MWCHSLSLVLFFNLGLFCLIWELPLWLCFDFCLYGMSFSILSLSVCMSVGLNWVSCRHLWVFFCIHLATPCIFVETFNPFTFNVTIYIHFYWHFLNCPLRTLSLPSLVFPAYRSPFNICCKDCLIVLNYLNFCFSVKLLISQSILNQILAR